MLKSSLFNVYEGKRVSSASKRKVSKISFIGCPAVGKTTIMKLLTGKLIDGKYVPTQGFDLGTVNLDDVTFKLWDFGGQKAYIKTQMAQFIVGSDIIFVVTDSTPVNVLTTKELVDYARELENGSTIVALANKQDLPGHLTASRVQDVLHIPTYPCVAISDDNRDYLIGLITKIIKGDA
jgi:ADP-ribosylation factor-like protein 2